MKTVQVLLSTYNGSKYLAQQLDTIFYQENVKIKLLVRDDGSNDNTVSILKNYQKKYSIKIIKGKNVGFAKSFWKLVQNANGADYYAFCDQDDIWERDKLASAINKINKEESNLAIPVLYTSNAKAVNNNLKVIEEKAFPFNGVLTLAGALEKSVLPGCTFVFNESLLKKAQKYHKRIIAHDWLMYQIADIFGKVVYDDVPHIRYRIHEGNTIGISSPRKELVDKVKRQFTQGHRLRRSEIALDLINTYGDEIPYDKRNLIKLFSQANKVKNWKRILTIKEYQNINFVLMLFAKKI